MIAMMMHDLDCSQMSASLHKLFSLSDLHQMLQAKLNMLNNIFCLSAGILQKKNPMKLRKELLIGFDPVRLFIQDVQQQCEGIAIFLVDIFGGHAIGVKWDAKALEAHPLDLQHASLLELVRLQSTGSVLKCTLSIPVLLSEVKASGAGLSHLGVQSSAV